MSCGGFGEPLASRNEGGAGIPRNVGPDRCADSALAAALFRVGHRTCGSGPARPWSSRASFFKIREGLVADPSTFYLPRPEACDVVMWLILLQNVVSAESGLTRNSAPVGIGAIDVALDGRNGPSQSAPDARRRRLAHHQPSWLDQSGGCLLQVARAGWVAKLAR